MSGLVIIFVGVVTCVITGDIVVVVNSCDFTFISLFVSSLLPLLCDTKDI